MRLMVLLLLAGCAGEPEGDGYDHSNVHDAGDPCEPGQGFRISVQRCLTYDEAQPDVCREYTLVPLYTLVCVDGKLEVQE